MKDDLAARIVARAPTRSTTCPRALDVASSPQPADAPRRLRFPRPTIQLAIAALASIAAAACDGGGRLAQLRFEVAAPPGECGAETGRSVAAANPCTTLRLYRRGANGELTPVPLVRAGRDPAEETAFELRFDRREIAFDAQLAAGERHDLVFRVFGDDQRPTAGARLENVALDRSEIRVRLYPYREWACAAPSNMTAELAPRALHAAIRVGRDVLLLGGITGEGIDPASAAPPRPGQGARVGALLSRVVEVYDAEEHRFHRVSVVDENGREASFGRVLFGVRPLGEVQPGSGRYRMRIVGGLELIDPASNTAVLRFDNSGSYGPLGVPLVPSDGAQIANSIDVVYDVQARRLQIEGTREPGTVARGAAVGVSQPLAGQAAILIGLSPSAGPPRPASTAYLIADDGGNSAALMLAHPRIGASIDALETVGGYLIWGGDLASTNPAVAANAGEFFRGTEPRPISSTVWSLPAPTAFHTSTRLSSDLVLIAGGWTVDPRGSVIAQPPDRALFALQVFADERIAARAVEPGPYVPTVFHSATPLPGLGVVILGGAATVAGDRLTPTGQVGRVRGSIGSFAYVADLPDLAQPRFGHTATELEGGRLLVVGGLARDEGGLRALSAPEMLYFDAPPTPLPDGACIDIGDDVDGGVDAGPLPVDGGVPDFPDAGVDAGPPVPPMM